MAAKKGKPGETPDRRGGGYFLFPDCVLASDAFRAASPLAAKLLMVLCGRHNGFNNGKIALSARDASAAIGCQNFKAISRSFGELEALGLAVLAKDRPSVQRMAREYRLTFVPVGSSPATNDYLQWQPGDAGTGKKRVAPTAAETMVSVVATAAGAKLSVAATAADRPKIARIGNVSAEHGSTHISNHRGPSAHPSRDDGKKAGGPRSKANGRASASVISAAPPLDEMRSRVTAHLAAFGRGSQSRLAAQTGIPAGTFSKFVHHGGPLNEQARILLACSLPRVAAAERKSERATA